MEGQGIARAGNRGGGRPSWSAAHVPVKDGPCGRPRDLVSKQGDDEPEDQATLASSRRAEKGGIGMPIRRLERGSPLTFL